MTSIFDRWTDLDPALALRRIEAAHGGAIFDRDSYTDPQRALLQIETAFGIELDDVNGLLDPSTLEDAIDTAIEAEADTTPEWVPDDAKIYIDLVNDRAWTEADGEVAIDTLLGTDANTDNAWGATSYDAGNLTADGYVSTGADTAIGFIGGSRDLVLAGASWVARFKQVIESNPGNPSLVLVSADGNNGIEIDFEPVDVTASSWGGSASLTSSKIRNSSLGAINVTAATITPLRLEFSANGSDPVDTSLTTDDYPPGDIVAALIELDNETLALQSITIYDPLPSTAGLSALSETGVTNTAPHGLTSTWNFGSEQGTIASVANASTTGPVADLNAMQAFITAPFTATDDEGSPITLSLSDDSNGLFELGAVLWPASGYVRMTADTLDPGTYQFTLRATDPGGLYVEQEFTIMVTA